MKKWMLWGVLWICLSLVGCSINTGKETIQNDGTQVNSQENDGSSNYLSLDQCGLDVTLDHERKNIHGSVTLTITNTSDMTLKEIHIRNYAANLSESILSDFSTAGVSLDFETDREDPSIVIVSLNQKLNIRDTIRLTAKFNTDIPKKKTKFGYTVYDAYTFYNLSYCFPTLSYFDGQWHDYPYTDEASEFNLTGVSSYQAVIHVPDHFEVVATGKETADGDNRVLVSGENLREFAAVISDGMASVQEERNGVKINYYYLDYENNKRYSTKVLESILDSYELYSSVFGAYLFDELDVVQTFMDSAMEYPGLAMLGLPDIKPSHYRNLDLYEAEVDYSQEHAVHEVAHQWFYAAVGNDPYKEPWLDEGLAEFCEDVLYHEKTISRREQKEFAKFMNQYIDQMTGDGRFIINKERADYAGDDYSLYVYEGGKMFLYELRDALGREPFYSLLQEYYQAYQCKIATTEDFYNLVLEQNGSSKIVKILDKYLEI